MTKKALMVLTVALLFYGLLVSSTWASSDARVLARGTARSEKVNSFNVGLAPVEDAIKNERAPDREVRDAYPWDSYGSTQLRRPLGATSANAGEGVGESVALTFNDYQATWYGARQIAHWYNGDVGGAEEVSVHFGYGVALDTAWGAYGDEERNRATTYQTGYNAYDATAGGDWPLGQDDGCQLQSTDTAGRGYGAILDMMSNGRAVIASDMRSARFNPDPPNEYLGRYFDARIYYQGAEFNCIYDPYTPLNVSAVDSVLYRDEFLAPLANRPGVYLGYSQLVTQFDGANTIVHLIASEDDYPGYEVPGYGIGRQYVVWFYFRKVGELASDSTWERMQVIDTLDFVYMGLDASQFTPGVACVYYNPSATGLALNKPDHDIFCRESFDRGLSWEDSYSITNYDNATEGSPNHFNASTEAHCMFDSEGDLHAWWIATPTSADPYNDGYNWRDFDGNLYHWEKNNGQTAPVGTGDIVKVANGTFLNPDMLTGSMNTFVCGFGGSNSSYVGWASMGECDGKLYMTWSQMHERANRMPWRSNTATGEPPLDDCSRVGNRGGMANWEILMSVARLETSTLWDYPRNITNTYRPSCGLPGDPDAGGVVCASEWHPQMEKLALDESGLDLTWPAGAEVDMSPEGETYTGAWYINMEYLDDQYPGPAWWGGTNEQGTHFHNPPPTLNSVKWIRLACVEPIEASRIAVNPTFIQWPEWVPLNTTEPQLVEVFNEGNVALLVDSIGTVGGSWLSVSETPTSASPWSIPAGVIHTDTMFININTAGISIPTWLEGYVWMTSDAVNADSVVIQIRVLAADTVEPALWEVVSTHENMYSPYLNPVGTCVGLAVGNAGELGYGGVGRYNLDYVDATPSMPVSNQECDTTIGKVSWYLVSASPYVIVASNSSGAGAEMTQVFNDLNQADATGFDPMHDKGTINSGVTASGAYDSVYTGRFVNRDTTIAMERIVYGPRSSDPANDIINFVIVYTKVYSLTLLPYLHTTIGNVADWDIPSDQYNHNLGGVGSGFVYIQGLDTTASDYCASHSGRYATEAFGGGYTSAEWNSDNCANNTDHRANGVYQPVMVDSTNNNGVPVDPPQPNPVAWWQTAAVEGFAIDPVPDTGADLCTFVTYKYDAPLIYGDTLHYWTVMTTTPIGGTLQQLTSQVSRAKRWYTETIRGCSAGCCEGRVGNVNNSGEPLGEEITLGDIMLMVDVLFISNDCTKLVCVAEADVNQSGEADPICPDDLTLGDIMILVDHLFIGQNPVNDCL